MTDRNGSELSVTRRGFAGLGAALAVTAGMAGEAAAAAPPRARRALPVADRLAVEDLFANYVWAYDCTDADEFITLFTADALVVGRGKLYSNREEIHGWFRYLINLRETEGDDIWMHEAGQFRIDVQAPDRCIVYAYATHFNGLSTTQKRGVRSLGYFICECVKVAGEWKFRRFSISTWDRNVLPWKKALPWAA